MIGNFENKLDSKGRVLVPSKLRKDLGSNIYISPGLDNVLTLRNEKEYKGWSEEFMKLPSNKANVRKIQRAILGNTFKISVDKIGRINIPDSLLERAGIEDDMVFVGLGKRIEIFSKDSWVKFMDQSGNGILEDAAEELEGFDI